MTREEKRLLLVNLCARLPYGIKVQYTAGDGTKIDCTVGLISPETECLTIAEEGNDKFVWRVIENIKPYLRPMSSMTEEEIGHCNYLLLHMEDHLSYYDYLNSIHIDYRGLIPMGLALPAPDGMYQ